MTYTYHFKILHIFVLSLLWVCSSFATSTTVTSFADDGPGSLKDALTVSTADTVFISPAISTITLTSQITIPRDVVIIGNGINETILSGGNETRLLASNFKVYISSMTIKDGYTTGQGGALFNGGNMTIENVLFTNNEASTDGGAIITTGTGTMTLTNVTLDNNRSLSTTNGRGGAIFVRNAATLIMEDCRVTNNSAMFSAGAISSTVPGGAAKLFMDRCVVSGNHSPNGGGGIVIFGDTVSITNSLITGNEANSGAGLYFGSLDTDPTTNVFIYNSTIAGNRCVQEGTALGRGSGIFIWNNTNLYMINTIVGDNTLDIGTLGPDIHFEDTGTFNDLGGNLISDITNINTTDPIISLVNVFPQFVGNVDPSTVPTTLGDYRLRCRSPAIDMGKDTLGLTMGVDITGSPRLVNGVIDIGAHERKLETSHMVTNTADDGIGSLRNTVNLSCPGDTVFFDELIDGEQIKLTTGQIDINNNIKIFGNGQGNTIIDGNGSSRIFNINEGISTTISNMVIQNGNATEPNFQAGGGIRNYKGDLKLYDVNITNCTADGGGGLHTQLDGITEIQRCRFSGNSASGGGGGLISEGITTMYNSVVSGNSSANGGAGIYISNTAILTNITVSGNKTSGDAGGILNEGVALTITNCIIAKNESSSNNLDIQNRYSFAAFVDGGYNLIGDTTGIDRPLANTTQFGTSANPLDPVFFKVANFDESEPGDMRLRCTSPALNAGTLDTTGLVIGLLDVSGLSRIVNNRVDIGAHERPAETAIREVVNNNDSGPGSLRDAVVTACTGDIVEIDEGVDGQTINIGDELIIDTDLDILGNGIDNTIINGGSSNRIFHIKPGVTSNISDMRIRKGVIDNPMNGGGIKNEGDVTIDQMVIENCRATQGGGIYNSPTGILTINQMFIDDCTASSDGGGIYNSPAGVLTFNNSTIYKNFGGDKGGGIFNAGQASLDRSAISANFTITNDGGGVYNLGVVDLINSTISANEGGERFVVNGGGIYNDGIFTIINSTVAGNKADHGGGVFNDSTFTMTNTIIAKNISGMGPDIRSDTALITDNGYNLIGDTSSLHQALHPTTLFGDQTMPLDPLFLKDAGVFYDNNIGFFVRAPGNLRLACSSPAVDMGTPNTSGLGIGSTDILGLPRIANGNVDIGAHERVDATMTSMVTNTGDSGLGSLRDEILSVCPNETIFFDQVTDGNTIQLSSEEIVIANSVTIVGNGQDKTFIDGMNDKRIFYIENGITANISALTIQNGRAQGEFGQPENGGGIYVEDGRLNLESVSITNCFADLGGGLYNADTITLSNTSVSSNNANHHGGGIYNSDSYASIVNSTIEQNSSLFSGGGVYNSALITFMNSFISGNKATFSGGGVFNQGASSYAALINTVISLNTAYENGGGVINRLGTVSFTNATISGNKAAFDAGGFYLDGGTATFTNTIVAKNLSTGKRDIFNGFSGSLTDNGNNLIGDATDVATHFDMSTLLGTAAGPLDPNFVRDVDIDTGDPGDLRLWCTSPAVDAGTIDTAGLQVGLVELQGSARIVGDAIDIGAYEYFSGHLGDLVLSNSIGSIERATNITAQVGVSANSTLFQVEETVTLEDAFDVGVGQVFEVQIEACPE